MEKSLLPDKGVFLFTLAHMLRHILTIGCIEINVYVGMSDMQVGRYQEILEKGINAVERAGGKGYKVPLAVG